MEQNVGIKCYINNAPGFNGILKHRYTDFKVNEVDLSGNVVRLTDLEPPPELVQPSNADAPQSIDDVVTKYADIVSATAHPPTADDTTDKIKTFLEQARDHIKDPASFKAPERPLKLGPFSDKDQRRQVHQLFKLPSHLPQCSTSVEAAAGDDAGGSSSYILVNPIIASNNKKNIQQQGGKGQKRKRQDNRQGQWPGGNLRYVKFAMYKENTDSHHAISTLAKTLHLGQKLFSVAGTKDKRGVTVQYVTAFQVAPTKLASANRHLRQIKLGNFSYAKEQLRLGDLSGNRFDIILRGIDTKDGPENVIAAAQSIKERGFINYFGLQRFGTSVEIPTHFIGRCLIRGEWQEAVKLILTPSEDARPEIRQACEAYLKYSDIKTAVDLMPHRCVGERAILQFLKQPESSNNYLGALLAIPRNLRSMYMHAYQSWLWNEAVSARLALNNGNGGIIAGDLVIDRKEMQRIRAARAGVIIGGGADNDDGDDNASAVESDEFVQPHVVTEAEAAAAQSSTASKYSLEDVVLPLPGNMTLYPNNPIKDVYFELASKDGIDLNSNKHNVKEFLINKLGGTYRHVIYRPEDFEYQLLNYDDPDVDIALTDLQMLGLVSSDNNNTSSAGLDENVIKKPGEIGKYTGLRLAFTLPSSCYATMLIRELTKMDTSKDFARTLPH